MISTITHLVPGKRVQLPGMPCSVLKRQAVDIPGSAQDWDYDWRAMNSPDHYRAAERLFEEAEPHEEPGSKN
jgi:hypothetical protein